MVQLSHAHMTTGEIIAVFGWTFARQVMSLLLSPVPGFGWCHLQHLGLVRRSAHLETLRVWRAGQAWLLLEGTGLPAEHGQGEERSSRVLRPGTSKCRLCAAGIECQADAVTEDRCLELAPGATRFAGDAGLELASCLLMSDLWLLIIFPLFCLKTGAVYE